MAARQNTTHKIQFFSVAMLEQTKNNYRDKQEIFVKFFKTYSVSTFFTIKNSKKEPGNPS